MAAKATAAAEPGLPWMLVQVFAVKQVLHARSYIYRLHCRISTKSKLIRSGTAAGHCANPFFLQLSLGVRRLLSPRMILQAFRRLSRSRATASPACVQMSKDLPPKGQIAPLLSLGFGSGHQLGAFFCCSRAKLRRAHTSLLLGLIRVADANVPRAQIMLCFCSSVAAASRRIHGKLERQPGLERGMFLVSAAVSVC
ncbi:unnamed protein product [Urochloa humidicola]